MSGPVSAPGALPVLDLPAAWTPGVRAFVTTRAGGVSAAPFDTLNLGDHVGDDPANVAENRRRVAAAARVAPLALITMAQCHGREVAWAAPGTPAQADALICERDDLALAVLVADCLPIVLCDPESPRFAVVHAGWRGLDAGVLEATLAHFAAPPRVVAAIGPGISPARYVVGPEVAARFADVPGALTPDEGDRSRLDLVAVAVAQLGQLGLDPARVHRLDAVTDDGALFFSHRAGAPTGRVALVARRDGAAS